MKAMIYTKYGPPEVLQLREVGKPAPEDDEVLVQVCASSANALDWRRFTTPTVVLRLIAASAPVMKRPILGSDLAGRVEAVGRNVKQFRPGDEVFGLSDRGCFAEYTCARENALALKPVNLSFEEAAAVPVAAVTALQGLRDAGQIRPGQKVLIQGASGGVGTFAVQLAKAFGAEVTAVCSTRNLDMARSIGADHAIDYTREDFSRSGLQYDLILAVNGYHSLSDYKRALSPKGVYIMVGGSFAQILQSALLGRWMSRNGGKKMGGMGMARVTQEELVFLKELLETGKVKPVIDRRYPLSGAAAALRYLVDEHARGKVVITVEPGQ
jgi:NADPH:quinone reductase-like Zn-dependent oxidoreductase